MPRPPTILLVIGMHARRVGGIEVHTRELVTRLASRGWQAVLCFNQAPAPEVREYLSLPNVTWEELPDAWRTSESSDAIGPGCYISSSRRFSASTPGSRG
jgi:hypothetical protein